MKTSRTAALAILIAMENLKEIQYSVNGVVWHRYDYTHACPDFAICHYRVKPEPVRAWCVADAISGTVVACKTSLRVAEEVAMRRNRLANRDNAFVVVELTGAMP